VRVGTLPGVQPEEITPAIGKRKKNRFGLLVFLPPALLAGSLIVNGAVQASQRGDATVQAERALKIASRKVPFAIRLPETLPDNARMVRVVLDEPDSDQGFQAYQLNVWYRTPGTAAEGGGRSVHVWQSNDKFLARRLQDPLQMVGKPVTIANQTWHQVTDDRVTQHVVTTFSKRYDDGITMTVDSKQTDMARAAIRALAFAD
jgi:hypothetical protein